MRRKIRINMPENQLKVVLLFAGQMINTVAEDYDNMDPEDRFALQQIKHSYNKMFKQFQEQAEVPISDADPES
jgi:hypothetical protein